MRRHRRARPLAAGVLAAGLAGGLLVAGPAAASPAAAQFASQVTVPFTGLNGPSGVAVDKAGDVFAADSGNNRVVELPAIAPLAVTTASLPGGTLGSTYSTTLAASGGTPPYTWSVSSGSLPPALSLNASTGVISGTPVLAGTFAFTVQATDSASPNQVTFTGPVTIEGGSVLSISGARFDSSLTVIGPASVGICGTSVGGTVTVRGATGPVLIGGTSGAACGTDTIGGPVTLTQNTGGVTLAGTTITGSVTITANTGGTVIAGNTITGYCPARRTPRSQATADSPTPSRAQPPASASRSLE